MVIGALVGLFLVVTALGGSKISRNALIFITILFAGGLAAIWWFLRA
jgi:hypothetical protein